MSGCDDQSDRVMYVVFSIIYLKKTKNIIKSFVTKYSNTGTESSLLRSNLTSRLSRARKLFEMNLEQTDIPKLMYKKRTERSTKHSEEAMYNLLFTGIEVLFSNEKQNESVRARVRGGYSPSSLNHHKKYQHSNTGTIRCGQSASEWWHAFICMANDVFDSYPLEQWKWRGTQDSTGELIIGIQSRFETSV